MIDLGKLIESVAAGLGKTLTVDQVASIAKDAMTFISGKVSTATWAEAARAGDEAAAAVTTEDQAEAAQRGPK